MHSTQKYTKQRNTTGLRSGYLKIHISMGFQVYSDGIYSEFEELGYPNRISTGASMKMIWCIARKSQGQGVNGGVLMMDVLSE